MNEKYIKIVYESEPIGPERIILYLTTFDIDKYNKDLQKERVAIEIPLRENCNIGEIERLVNDYVKNFYEPYIKEVKGYLQYLKTTHEIEPKVYEKVNNVANVDKVTCNIIKGNVVNCDVVYCNEVKGNVVNCDINFK